MHLIITHQHQNWEIPPTNEAFSRKSFQAAILKNYLSVDPPTFNLLDYGWARDPISLCLRPTTVTNGVKLVLDDLLKIIYCGCSSEHPYKTQRCICTKSGLTCSIFCECKGCVTRYNPWTLKTVAGDKNIEEEGNELTE